MLKSDWLAHGSFETNSSPSESEFPGQLVTGIVQRVARLDIHHRPGSSEEWPPDDLDGRFAVRGLYCLKGMYPSKDLIHLLVRPQLRLLGFNAFLTRSEVYSS